MEWIDKKYRMPDKHPEYEECSKDVIVTDGVGFGVGRYYKEFGWAYVLNNKYEQTDNNITHWIDVDVLPINKSKNETL